MLLSSSSVIQVRTERMAKAGLKTVSIRGDQSPKARQEAIDSFVVQSQGAQALGLQIGIERMRRRGRAA